MNARERAARLAWLVSLGLAVASCGGGGEGDRVEAPTATAPAPTPSPSPSPSPAPAPAPAPTPSPSPSPSPGCAPLAERIRSTTLAVTGNAAPNDEYTPAIIAPKADGTSLLAWTDRAGPSIRMVSLSANDAIADTLPGVAGLEVHAMLATAQGAALAVVADDPDIHSTKYCRTASTPGNAVCGRMDLVRVDAAGTQQTRTTLTKKGNVDTVGAQFIWWYGHTARLAANGNTLGVYYRSAMSTARPGVAGEVDIHAGDTLKFVDATNGNMLSGGWDWGCSHSWSVRLAHNGKQWAAACHGDAYPNAMRVARLASPSSNASTLQWAAGSDPAQRAFGGLVATAGGHWLNHIDTTGGQRVLSLSKVPDSGNALVATTAVAAATGIDGTYPFRPYLAAYGTGRLLLGWKSGGKLVLAVADATSGAVLEGPVTSTLPIDNFQDMVTTPSGDVVWAHSAGGTRVQVQRVAACRLPS